jgi:hypothetical protein
MFKDENGEKNEPSKKAEVEPSDDQSDKLSMNC